MPFKITCQCDRVLVVPDKRAGTVIRCPKCERKIKIPEKLSRKSPPPHLIDQALADAAEPLPPPIEGQRPTPIPQPPPRQRANEETQGKRETRKGEKGVASDKRVARDKGETHSGNAKKEKPPAPPVQLQRQDKAESARPAKENPPPRKESPPQLPQSPTAADSARNDKKSDPSEPQQEPSKRKRKSKPTPPQRETQQVSTESPPRPTAPSQPAAAASTPYRSEADVSLGASAGYLADRGRRQTVVYLAFWLLVITATSLIPAAMEIAARLKLDIWPGIPLWIHLLILFAGIQVAYSVYLIQLPDWSTIWVVSVVTLIQAMAYSMLLGISLLASMQSPLLQSLELANHLQGGSISLWCLVMICLYSLFSYFGGRFGLSWRNTRLKLLRSLEPPVGTS